MHYMIDLETLDTKPSSVILSIGIVAFNREGIMGKLEIYPSIQEQINKGRTIDETTFLWWLGQEDGARMAIIENPRNKASTVKAKISDFIDEESLEGLWGNGADFDITILRSYYDTFELSFPYPFWAVLCYRTVKSLFPRKIKEAVVGIKHTALSDAYNQAESLISRLKEGGRDGIL